MGTAVNFIEYEVGSKVSVRVTVKVTKVPETANVGDIVS